MTLSPQDRLEFEAYLLDRMQKARLVWDAAKKAQPLKLELSYDMPQPDGMLARQQANGNRELITYSAALKDYTDMAVHGKWRAELMRDWQTGRRKPMGAAGFGLAKRQRA